MHRSLVRVSTIVLALMNVFPLPAPAQRVLGIGDDALVLPRGALRIRTLAQWTSFNERYGLNTPGRADGSLEPLGIDFALDTVGVTEFPNLALLQGGLRQLTGNPNFGLSLGSTRVDLRGQVTAIPIVVEGGLTRRFSVGIEIPYVQTRNSAVFDVNPAGREGNVGFNPALASPAAAAQNTTMLTQFTTAAAQLEGTLNACRADPSVSPQCPALLAQEANARALINNSRAFAGGAVGPTGVYTVSPFVPIRNTDAQLAIEARVAAFRALYAQFGITGITTTGPFASQNTLTLADAQTILTDPNFGVVADPLQTIERSHVGDIDIGGKFLLLDTFGNTTTAGMSPQGLNFRAAVGGVVRLPTGQAESPNNFIDIGTGHGQTAVEGRLFADVLIGSRFWQSFVFRYTNQLSDEEEVRIIDLPNKRLAPLYRRQTVDRDLGNIFEVETSPRFVVNDFFAVSGHYVYRNKSEDKYTGTFIIPAAITGFSDVTLDASTLNLETEQTEHRLGGGISFSNLYAFEQKRARIPFEVTYLHWQTVKGTGNVPKAFTDQIQLRLYTRLFGN